MSSLVHAPSISKYIDCLDIIRNRRHCNCLFRQVRKDSFKTIMQQVSPTTDKQNLAKAAGITKKLMRFKLNAISKGIELLRDKISYVMHFSIQAILPFGNCSL